MRVLVIQNCEIEDLGLYAQYMRQRGIEYDVMHAYRQDARFESAREHDVCFVGGTPVSIREVDQHPFLQREWAHLQKAVNAGLPCFGVCGGGQLLARVLGAEVRRNPEMEIGQYNVRLTPSGESDPLLRGFPPEFPVFQWHGDTFDVPADASLLAESDICRNQLFRRENVVAVQFHLEVTADTAAIWAEQYADELESVNKDRRTLVEECRNFEGQARELCCLLMDNFFGPIS